MWHLISEGEVVVNNHFMPNFIYFWRWRKRDSDVENVVRAYELWGIGAGSKPILRRMPSFATTPYNNKVKRFL